MSNDSAIIHFPCNNAYNNMISVCFDAAIACSCMPSQLSTIDLKTPVSSQLSLLTVNRDESMRCTFGPAVYCVASQQLDRFRSFTMLESIEMSSDSAIIHFHRSFRR